MGKALRVIFYSLLYPEDDMISMLGKNDPYNLKR